MGRKKTSKAKKRVAAVKQRDPTAVINEEDWVHHEPEGVKRAPHSFVICRGKVGRPMKELMRDMRRLMEPFTASNLKMRKGNVLRDYVSIASYFHVTHLFILRRTQVSPYLKICGLPRGPTMTFRVMNYTLARDVLSSLRKQVTFDAQFQHHPLLLLNNFSGDSNNHQLITSTFQSMIPSININNVKVAEIRRVLLLNYIEEDDSIEVRHYTVVYKATGVSKRVQKVLLSKHGKIPNLGKCEDIADFLNKDGDVSESEAEDNTETVGVSQKLTKLSKGLEEVGVKLVELGPRLRLQLIKVEEGMCDGEVLFHKLVEKTAEEKLRIRKKRILKKSQKAARKREQDMNIDKKRKEKEQHRKRCFEGMGHVRDQQNQEADDNDREWYRKEVGEEPDEDQFNPQPGSTLSSNPSKRRAKSRDGAGFDGSMPKRPRVSKFAAVKEKARLMKLNRKKNELYPGNQKGFSRGRSNFNSKTSSRKKGDGTYTKPRGGSGMKSKVNLRVGGKKKPRK